MAFLPCGSLCASSLSLFRFLFGLLGLSLSPSLPPHRFSFCYLLSGVWLLLRRPGCLTCCWRCCTALCSPSCSMLLEIPSVLLCFPLALLFCCRICVLWFSLRKVRTRTMAPELHLRVQTGRVGAHLAFYSSVFFLSFFAFLCFVFSIGTKDYSEFLGALLPSRFLEG